MEGCVSDVYDGEVYKKYADFFSGEYNIPIDELWRGSEVQVVHNAAL